MKPGAISLRLDSPAGCRRGAPAATLAEAGLMGTLG
jgi:hypothetical protein